MGGNSSAGIKEIINNSLISLNHLIPKLINTIILIQNVARKWIWTLLF